MRKTAILLALACAFARADYGPGTTDSDLLRSGTPVVTNAWLAVSNETVRIARSVAGDAGAITDGTNRIDATRDVWRMFSGRVCTNASEVWTYSVGGATYTAEQMTYAVGGGDPSYSQTLVWMNSPFIGKDGEEEQFEGWFVNDGSGSRPVGYSYITGETPESSADHFLALAEYVGLDYAGMTNVSITAFRGTFESGTNYVGRLALTNDIPDVSGYTTQQQATNAATAVADAKISTNNAAFVSAVLAVPLTGADAGDLAEIAEYGGYGTVGAAILALIAGLAALKRRMATAETAVSENATAVASVRADLPYALVTPGEWEFSEPQGLTNFSVTGIEYSEGYWTLYYTSSETGSDSVSEVGSETDLSVLFYAGASADVPVTATRPSLPGHLCDRAGNRVVVSGATTLTLPAANPGYLRDFLVRLEISGSTVPTITFAAPTGETITYETDGDEFPVPDEAGTWSYSFTENCVAHKFAVSLKKVNEVAAPHAQGGV